MIPSIDSQRPIDNHLPTVELGLRKHLASVPNKTMELSHPPPVDHFLLIATAHTPTRRPCSETLDSQGHQRKHRSRHQHLDCRNNMTTTASPMSLKDRVHRSSLLLPAPSSLLFWCMERGYIGWLDAATVSAWNEDPFTEYMATLTVVRHSH